MDTNYYIEWDDQVERTRAIVSGHLTINNSARFKKEILERTDAVPWFFMDFCHVEYIDSNAIAILINISRTILKSKRRFILIASSPKIERLVTITQLHKIMPVCKTLEEAEAMVFEDKIGE
jgi:anti-anti-sigma factor